MGNENPEVVREESAQKNYEPPTLDKIFSTHPEDAKQSSEGVAETVDISSPTVTMDEHKEEIKGEEGEVVEEKEGVEEKEEPEGDDVAEVKEEEATEGADEIDQLVDEVAAEFTGEPTEKKGGFNWDSANNPYKQESERYKNEALKMQEQVKNTRDSYTRDRQILLKMAEEGGFDLDQIQESLNRDSDSAKREFNLKWEASKEAEARVHGPEILALENDEAYQSFLLERVDLQHRIQGSKSPYSEYMKVHEEKTFFDQYGSDPKAIKDNIIAEYEKTVLPERTKEVARKLMDKIAKRTKQPEGVGGIKGSQVSQSTKDEGPKKKSLNELFSR